MGENEGKEVSAKNSCDAKAFFFSWVQFSTFPLGRIDERPVARDARKTVRRFQRTLRPTCDMIYMVCESTVFGPSFAPLEQGFISKPCSHGSPKPHS